MPHKLLADYLKFVEQAILNCKTAYVERYIEDILTPERVNLRIRIRFQQGHLLEINEAVEVVKIDTLRSKDTLDSADRFRLGSTQSLILATAVKHRLLS